MDRARHTVLNLFGFVLKLTITPILFEIFATKFDFQPPPVVLDVFSWFLIILGLIGVAFSDLLILRYGDGRLYFHSQASRLVDVGFYAQNRHPSLWFLGIYQLGIIFHFSGLTSTGLFIWLSLLLLCIAYIILFQERNLRQSLGSLYSDYQRSTPFVRWKLAIPPSQRVRILAQFVWIFGRIYLRNWYNIKTVGTEHIPKQRPFIVVANHETYIDPLLFSIFIPFEIQFVTTADVFTTPLLQFLLKGIGTFPMRRHRQDLKSIRTMLRLIKGGQVVGIFPEGGRSIDGSPLPILKETLKLIQHSKVPILPVHLEGAYEIWPRWAPNRRRGNVTANFKPIISVEDQVDLRALEKRIQSTIFAEKRVFSKVKSTNIVRGLDKFLWACTNCNAHNSIHVLSATQIRCNSCEREWQLSHDYIFTNEKTGETHTLISWLDDNNTSLLNFQEDLPHPIDLDIDEIVYLYTPIIKYTDEAGKEETLELSLILTDHRMLLLQNQSIITSWPLTSITIFTMDYNNAVSIGVGGIRHMFFFPANEIILKWQMYYDAIQATKNQN